jgi:hypothetical protein
MRIQSLGPKPNFAELEVRNDETVSIPAGTPVAYVMDGTEDGLAVIKPSTSNLKSTSLLAGILIKDLTTTLPKLGKVQAYGVVDAIVRLATRAATSDSYTSLAAHAVGMLGVVDTVNDCILTLASTGSGTYLPAIVIAEAIASQAASATATTITDTVKTTKAKVFIRALG